MNHLDEGTIHAWLDGALSAAESRDIETHMATCAMCSAAVAEARGLVAGASRILNALDDVPANVVPKRAPTAPPTRRQWRAAPWVTGIAAALLLAVGVTTISRDPAVAPQKNSVAQVDSATVVALPPAAAAADEARLALRRDLARGERQSAPAAPAPSATLADTRRFETASDTTRMTASRGGGGAGAAAGSAVTGASNQNLRRLPAGAKFADVIVTAAPTETPETPMKSAVLAPQRGPAAIAEADRLAGCYRIPTVSEERVMAGAAASIAGRLAAGARVRERAAAPTADRPAAQYAAPAAPEIVRLDTVRHPLGFVVRAARSDSTIGTWLRIAGDSARIDLPATGLFRFSFKDRTACP